MKRVKILIVFLTLFFFGYSAYMYHIVTHRRIPMFVKANPDYKLTDIEKSQLQEGDVILRRGEGFVSSVINNLGESEYQISHCAFLIKNDGEWNVIHTVSSDLSDVDGVQTEPLDKFTGESVEGTIVVLRFKTDSVNRGKIADRSRYYLNRQIHFDNNFDISDTTEFYCTELIYRVALDVFEKDFFAERHDTNHPNYLTFEVFLDNKKFDIILNHQGDKVTKHMKN